MSQYQYIFTLQGCLHVKFTSIISIKLTNLTHSALSILKAYSFSPSQGWEIYREAQWRYRTVVRKASQDAWRTFCNSANNLPMSVMLNRALSIDPKNKQGSLVALSVSHMQSKG